MGQRFASNYVGDAPVGEMGGIDHAKQVVTNFRAAFPDIRITIEELVAKGDIDTPKGSSARGKGMRT